MAICKKCNIEMEKVGPVINSSNTKIQKWKCKKCGVVETKAMGLA